MVVPWLGADRTSSRPPSAASLSAMFPQARTHRGVAGVVAGSVVGHGEAQRSAAGLKGDAAVDAWAYLAMFCSASRQQKYTAASVSCGNRPIPSASTVTGTADLPVWALSAATSPRSASSGG